MGEESDSGSNGRKVPQPFFSGGEGDSTASYGGQGLGPRAQIGQYKLLGILGEGGYGIVYLAQQERPLKRRVALKIVKPGMDSKQVIARFEAERQALALLDHPNLAHIYNAGTTEAGRPYFAMEYVEGLPITEYCDREKLDIRQRLQLFQQVCHAIQHAHQKGIIHRDLKPSNILITATDDEPLVKVIDFGIAKALAQSLTEKTLYTQQGQFIGTPDYMSPEQAEMDAQGVDTRSDVYSLGVVLYELLAGVLPFDPEELRTGGLAHIQAVLREQEPRTPSTRLTGLGEKAQKIAERRGTDPKTLARSLHKELEWIPLKAMRKECFRRYQSASEFAGDIENYLQGKPLAAGPESATYRIRKFVQRHRGSVAAAAVVIASLLIGIIITSRMYVVTERARRIAETSQTAEAAQRQAAEHERNRAVEAEEEANRHLVDFYEEQGRRYMDLGDLDRALVLLTEALKNDSSRLTARLLAEECLRKHPDPNLHDGAGLRPWEGEPLGPAPRFAMSPDRRYVAFMDEGGSTVRIFDTETAEERIRIEIGDVSQLVFIPGNKYFIAKVEDRESHHTIGIFNLETGEEITSIKRARIHIDELMSRLDGSSVPRGTVEEAYQAVLISPDGRWMAFLDADCSSSEPESWVVLWDFEKSELHVSPKYPFETLLIGLGVRPGNILMDLVALDRQQACRVWETPELKPQMSRKFGVVGGIMGIARTIALKPGNLVELHDRSGYRVIRRIPGVDAFGFSPDQARFVTKTASGVSIRSGDLDASVAADLWDSTQGNLIAHLPGATLGNWHFSRDSRFLVTEHCDHGIQIWDTDTGRKIFSVSPEVNHTVADIGPNGNWLVTRDHDTKTLVQIWHLATGTQFQPYVTSPTTSILGMA